MGHPPRHPAQWTGGPLLLALAALLLVLPADCAHHGPLFRALALASSAREGGPRHAHAGRGVPRRSLVGIRRRPFKNITEAGLALYRAHQVKENLFAIVGLGRTSIFRRLNCKTYPNGTADHPCYLRLGPLGACSFTPEPSGDEVMGTARLITNDEHLHIQYTFVVVFCEVPPGAVPSSQLSGTGATIGTVQVQLGNVLISEYVENSKHRLIPGAGEKKRRLVFCARPLFGNFEPRSITQWLAYHLYHVGPDHFYLYDAGGFDQKLMAQLEAYRRANLITVIDIKDQRDYPSWLDAQAFAMHDCMYHNGLTAEWVAFMDFDEYFITTALPPTSVRSMLDEYRAQGAQWLSHGTFWYSNWCGNATEVYPKANFIEDADPLRPPRENVFAVELATMRWKLPYCRHRTVNRNLCPVYQGHRKLFVDPQKIEMCNVHRVVLPPDHVGVNLYASNQGAHGHFRGILMKRGWCEPLAKIDGGQYRGGLQGGLEVNNSIASVAADTRRCLDKGLPTYQCQGLSSA